MQWYFVENGKQAGPVDEDELIKLAALGRITDQTLVWNQTMVAWTAWGEARPQPQGPPRCVRCGALFPDAERAAHQGKPWVCPGCFEAVMAANNVASASIRYAGFWIRFVAKIIDGCITSLLSSLAGFIVGMGAGMSYEMATATDLLMMGAFRGAVTGLIIAACYNILFVGRFGATPGKMLLGLKIVTAEGNRVSYARALGRYLAEFLSGVIFLLGYVMAAFDRQKRALHDHLASTRVIHAR